ncbi:MAG: hypothetical protein WD078_01745 [Woeseia sp.]
MINIVSVAHRCRLLGALFAPLVLVACATTSNVQQIDRLKVIDADPRVLLMPPDVRYYLLTAGGVSEPHAEWTMAAQTNIDAAIRDLASDMGTDLVVLNDDDLTPDEMRYRSLHSAVGQTVLTNHFGSLKLPSKNRQFDWSLGSGIQSLAADKEGDYALFVFYRDEQASGGRIAFAVLAAAAGGYASVGAEYGFASLVDLETGDIVWFNVVTAGSGEMRDPEGAATAVRTLFRDIPTNRTVE